ncbi:MAG: penicillin-binding protein 2 [Chloroflexi bacterium]|nr:penicillin-binding protein 2 [Chloroflexota bacterium]
MSSIPTGMRLRVMQLALCAVFVLLAVQVIRLQWLDPVVPADYASGIAPRDVALEPPRGLITDRNGVVLAHNTATYRVVLIPGELPAEASARRSALFTIEQRSGIPFDTLEAAASTVLARVDPFAPVRVRDELTHEDAVAIRARLAGVRGVRVQATPARAYASDATLAHLLGTIGALPVDEVEAWLGRGYPVDGVVGLTGVEASFEAALRGQPGRRLVLADPQGREVALIGEAAARPGADIVLSIDLELQHATAAALAEGIERGLAILNRPGASTRPPPAPAGAALVMDVRTGELLASVSLPSYDPNLFSTGSQAEIERVLTDPARPLIDRTYMEVRSPGSIFKPLVALAALEAGIATASTRITSTGAITIRDLFNPGVVYVFRDWAAHGSTDMAQALARSSDVYFYLLAGGYDEVGAERFEGLGADTLAEWARRAGLGAPTGIDLPGEAPGTVPDSHWKEEEFREPWLLGDTYTFGIGQGYLTTTPLQMAVLTAALANGGRVLQPTVLHGLSRQGLITAPPPREWRDIGASAANLQTVREGMLAAAAPAGTARTGVPAGVSLGAKTGTAEFGVPYPDGQYDTHGWYIAFGPYEDPEVAVVVYLEYGVGSTHAGPVAKAILEAYFAQRNAPADTPTTDQPSAATR